MLESAVETHLRKRVKAVGGECIKLVGVAGIPDRLCILPGRIVFVELKRPGERPRPLQLYWQYRLKKLGCEATWCDSIEAVDRIIP